MWLLYLLEGIRNPIFDAFFSAITLLGDEVAFMAIGMIVFWCVDKYQGYFLFCIGFIGTVVNQFLKMIFRIPRPWVKDPSFTIVESAREAATGYSFPSGHTQTSVGAFGGLARWNKHKLVRVLAISACVLVPFSRMYLGVHTPLDVGVSVVLALAMVFIGYPLFKKAASSPKIMYAILTTVTLLSLALLLFVSLYQFPAEVYGESGIHNLTSARKNGYTLLGCGLGFIAVYTVDIKYTNFTVKAVWWAQILKVLGGLALIMLVKEGLRAPIDAIFGGHLIARAVRYMLMVIVGGALWPMTFNWFSKLGAGRSDDIKEEK